MEVSLKELLKRTEPHGLMRQYFGNGKNAYHGGVEIVVSYKGNLIKVVEVIRRYSYRWHKRTWEYYVNDCRVFHRSTFKAELRSLGYIQ